MLVFYMSQSLREERVQTGTNNNCYAAVFISDSAGEEEEVSDVITHDALIKLTNISQLLHCCPLEPPSRILIRTDWNVITRAYKFKSF